MSLPYSVAASFSKFFEAINLDGDHREIANKRRDRIVELLSNKIEIVESFPTGSIPKFTAVTGHADVDVMVALHYSKHIKGRRPSQVLATVREALAGYSTKVRRNGQAVTLSYESWPNVDIVPVSRVANSNGSTSHYNVPDMHREEWLMSRPKRHAINIAERVKTFGGEFRHLIKMVKWWNYEHFSELQSYHLEVIALKALNARFDEYPWQIYRFFDSAHSLCQSALYHQGGYVDNYLNYDSRRKVVGVLSAARDIASRAWFCTHNGRGEHEKAIGLWRRLFGNAFPAYG